jgi:hypothetical protein
VRTEKLSPQLRQAITQAAKAASASAARPAGFVPRTRSSGIRPDTWGTCNNHVCTVVYGTGRYVSSVWQSFFNYGGCHQAHIYWGNHSSTGICFYANSIAIWPFHYTLSRNEYMCGDFIGVPGIACVYVHN